MAGRQRLIATISRKARNLPWILALLDYSQALKRASQYPVAPIQPEKAITLNWLGPNKAACVDLVLRRLTKGDDVPKDDVCNNRRRRHQAYLADGQPAVAKKLVLEFTLYPENPIRCQVLFANCGGRESDYYYSMGGSLGAKMVAFLTKLVRVFDNDPTVSKIPLPAAFELTGQTFDSGKVQGWASSAYLSMGERWVDPSKSISEAYVVRYWPNHESHFQNFGKKVDIEVLIDGQKVSCSRVEYSKQMRKATQREWKRWMGPLQPLPGNPSVEFYSDVRARDIKRNVVGEIMSCRIEEVGKGQRVHLPDRGLAGLLKPRQHAAGIPKIEQRGTIAGAGART